MKLFMTTGLLARIVIVVSLMVLLSLQIFNHTHPATAKGREIYFSEKDTVTIEEFDRKFPLSTRSASDKEIKKAYHYLNIPIWSNNFPICEQNTEYSCYELVQAYKIISNFMERIQTNPKSPSILLKFNTTHTFSSVIGSVYAAFAVCLATNRRLYIQGLKDTQLLNKKIQETINTPLDITIERKVLSNHTFSCADFSDDAKTIEFDEGMWAQSVYIHPTVSPKLRKLFGMHAAHFLGNFLFGDYTGCANITNNSEAIAIMAQGSHNIKKPDLLKRANICLPHENFSVIEFDSKLSLVERKCKLREAINSKYFAYPLGDAAGWMAQAMKGRPGIAVQMKDNGCFNVSNSQAGSIDHLKNRKKNFAYSVNNHFYTCGSNINDIRIFVKRILW